MANILIMIRRRGEGGRAPAAWLVVVVIHGGEIERAREAGGLENSYRRTVCPPSEIDDWQYVTESASFH